MAWVGVVISAFGTLICFFICVRNANRWNPYSGELCELYLLKHMLRDGHPLGFMYKGLPRNRDYPRLLWPCVSTLAGTVLTLVFVILAAVLGAKGVLATKNADLLFFYLCMGSVFFADLAPLAIEAVQNRLCFRKMMKMSMTQIGRIYAEIEKKWPGFFDLER